MTLVDRYVLTVFLRVFVISFVSVAGMFIMGDLVGHISEFTQGGDGVSVVETIWDFYAARIPWLFDMLGRVVTLIAAAFTMTWMQRSNELTALMAAGISRWRVLRPILIAAIAISLTAAANREWVLPRQRESLRKDVRNVNGKNPRPVQPLRDYQTDILIGGRSTITSEKRIYQPTFNLPPHMASFGTRILAENANYLAAEAHHPAGYLLYNVREPINIDRLESLNVNDQPVLMTSRDTPWLQPGMCFVVTALPFEFLEAGSEWRKVASLRELLQAMRNPALDFGVAEQLAIHARLVQPFLDLSLLMLGLPLVIERGSRGIFVSIGSGLIMVAVYFLGVALAHTLALNLFLAPVLSAWLPLMVFVPLAVGVSGPLFR